MNCICKSGSAGMLVCYLLSVFTTTLSVLLFARVTTIRSTARADLDCLAYGRKGRLELASPSRSSSTFCAISQLLSGSAACLCPFLATRFSRRPDCGRVWLYRVSLDRRAVKDWSYTLPTPPYTINVAVNVPHSGFMSSDGSIRTAA